MIYQYSHVTGSMTEGLAELAEQSEDLVYKGLQRNVIPVLERALDRTLRVEPPRPDYPIQWTSPKQKRYVLWKLRKEGNLPYKRRHTLVKKWVSQIRREGTELWIEIVNTSPVARYVYGPQKQRFLYKWLDAEKVSLQFAGQAEPLLFDLWESIVKSKVRV